MADVPKSKMRAYRIVFDWVNLLPWIHSKFLFLLHLRHVK